MKDTTIAEKLFKEGAIGEASYQKVSASYATRLFSVGLEVRTILYLGILLLTSGLGVLVYKNIDSIGHLAIIAFIALVSLGCFAYAYTKRMPYSNQKVISAGVLVDYVLLLGCLTFGTFMGYLQYQYSTFGPHHEIAFLIPAILFFAIAYYFDHIGILSMAITAIAGFIGVVITPTALLSENDFSSERIIYSGLALGIALVATALTLNKRLIKSHFTFTYLNFAMHMLFIACLAGLFLNRGQILFMLPLALFVFLVIQYAYKEKSFYLLLFSLIYGYIGVTYLFFYLFLIRSNLGDSLIALVPMYFIGSAGGAIVFLRNANKKMRAS